VTLYVEPTLYERVRCAAYTLGEDIYVFAGEALDNAIDRRMTPKQRAAVESMAKQNIKNNGAREKRR
jgi:hypothetical protein